MSLELPHSIKIINPLPVDEKYLNAGVPWTSDVLANAGIPIEIRHIGLTVNINNVEWWYKDGTADLDLVLKSSGDLTYEHDQQVPSTVWNVTHNLGKYPSVMVVDSGLNEVIGDIQYTGLNTLVITFSSTFSGKAYMN